MKQKLQIEVHYFTTRRLLAYMIEGENLTPTKFIDPYTPLIQVVDGIDEPQFIAFAAKELFGGLEPIKNGNVYTWEREA